MLFAGTGLIGCGSSLCVSLLGQLVGRLPPSAGGYVKLRGCGGLSNICGGGGGMNIGVECGGKGGKKLGGSDLCGGCGACAESGGVPLRVRNI